MMAGAPESESKPKPVAGDPPADPTADPTVDVSTCFEILTENFATLARAKGGIPKLRETILQLAVQGRLVPQDPADEPASVLLERIQKEKARLVKEKKIKKAKTLPPVDADEVPYVLPEGWVWTRLGEGCMIVGGGTPKTTNPEYFCDVGVPWLTPADLGKIDGKYIDKGRRDITELGLNNSSAQLLPKGSVLFSSRAPIGHIAIAQNEISTNQGFKSSVPYIMEMNEFVFIFLKSHTKRIQAEATGTTFKEISGKEVSRILLPLPPLPEQHRIVERVDTLMALCDELEARQDAEAKRRRMLLESVLHALQDGTDPEGVAAAREIFAENFDLLVDDTESIADLRKTILQLAVQGRLVEQDPVDEPASVLLERISAEKVRLVKERKIKKAKVLPPVDMDEVPYALPEGWVWTRLGGLSHNIEYGSSHKATESNVGVPILRMNNICSGCIQYDNLKYVPDDIDDLPRLFLNTDDILFNRTNSYELVGKSGVFKGEDKKFTFASYLIRVVLANNHIFPNYINVVLNSRYFRTYQIEPEITQQCGQANFNGTKLKNSIIPLPPLPEQHRIVERVDTLMALCDELDARVRAQEDAAERLLASVCDGICG